MNLEDKLIERIGEIIENKLSRIIDVSSNQIPIDKIIGIQQAAIFLELAIPTIYKKTSQGQIPHFKKGGKLYFKESELIEWIESGKVSTLADHEEELNSRIQNRNKS